MQAASRTTPALDGLRGLAVTAVLLYHGNVTWIPGGYLGVDLFFVLSGYLITALLLAEWRESGTITLRGFWARRARRLLPALIGLLAGVIVFGAVLASASQVAHLRGDILATLGYVANWRAVSAGHAYMDRFAAPSPLMHAWSLAVEEHWYLLWPLLLLALLRCKRIGVRGIAIVTLGLALLSGGWAWWLTRDGGNVARAHYGTDTRAQSLLVGALLAMILDARPAVRTGLGRAALGTGGFLGAATVGWLWMTTATDPPSLFHGRLALGTLGVAVMIACVVQHRQGVLARACSWRPLVAAGIISYGLYLWHWPVYLTLDRDRTDLSGSWLLATRIAVSVACSVASYRLIERPIRSGAYRSWSTWARRAPATITAVGLVATLMMVTAGASTSPSLESVVARVHRDLPPSPPAAPVVPTLTRAVLLGDSTALMLGTGFGSHGTGSPDLQLYDLGVLGCGLLRRGQVHISGAWGQESEKCDWTNDWARVITTYQPDLVVLLSARWDIADRRVDGRYLTPGNDAYAAYFVSELDAAVTLLSSQGARVVMLTSPHLDRALSPGIDDERLDPRRVELINDLYRSFATSHPRTTAIIEYGWWIDEQESAGRDLRPDGVHLVPKTAPIAGDWLTPQLVALGDESRAARAR